ncbi:4-hydroxy-tetrahydrodipicolinate reductase [Methanococcoides burtonii]|uniref:4-hydroxy-tetrahydrodipicolinate reductase n=1 Tax=Methanococcoides burtonii (strain DSM 6242 / NBRC 107633 / OCM 468 / ACE-M) TaxID=259564 RepID=DAPB_METBU|nr:4-hydroxy-tetrahydrodipicolinate reductase [Methanococcoides burtonii]Q12ZG1.1 RecName: Full=4-hydroxy-tetrahydrodipicolinate reductase; Short=HTPA reductase [Methanococcoides burtonii DSM 6242]ABE51165.1 Dihydrodipicolinate reductase [Methanococcoides burtonii DSM 6242]
MINAGVTGASGRMGKLIIENIIKMEGIQLSSAFDLMNIGKDVGEVAQTGKLDVNISDVADMATVLKESKTNVVIDFTIAPATVANAPVVAGAGVDLIIGTTGFSDEQRATIEGAIIKNGTSAVISPNYSVGVNVFFKILQETAKYLSEYDIEIIEAHHNQKKDAPSGTAMKAAEVISETLGGKDFVYGREGLAPRDKEIGIHAVRGGDIVGDHTVLFAGDGERIEIKHQAHSRNAFASGAVKAAIWINNAGPGIHTMDDILGS